MEPPGVVPRGSRQAQSQGVSWAERTQPIQVGDTVAYSAAFLRSIGCYSGDMPQARGQVTALVPVGKDVLLAEITWDLPDLPARVNVKNLTRARGLGLGA